MKPFFLLCAFVFFIASCTHVYYTSDQPSGAEPLREVPAGLWGTYTGGDDSLIVRPGGFTTIEHKDHKVALKDTLSAGLTRTPAGAWKFGGAEAQYYHVRNVKKDTVYYMRHKVKEYKLGADTLLKFYKGDYYLSMKHGTVWMVYQITPVKGNLVVKASCLDKKERAELRKQHKENKPDSAGHYTSVVPFRSYDNDEVPAYVVEANPDQLLALAKKGLFKPVVTFKKVPVKKQ